MMKAVLWLSLSVEEDGEPVHRRAPVRELRVSGVKCVAGSFFPADVEVAVRERQRIRPDASIAFFSSWLH